VKISRLGFYLFWVSGTVLLSDRAVWAEQTSAPIAQVSTINKFRRFSQSASGLLAQEKIQPRQITNVRLLKASEAVEITLEASEAIELRSQSRAVGNTLVAEIENAVLTTPNGFRFEKPAAGITAIVVTQLQGNRVQVSVTGETGVPIIQIKPGARLILVVTPDDGQEEEVTVTGSQAPSYLVPNASTATGTDTPILETPFSVQVVPQEVLRDQQVIRIEDALENISGVNFAGSTSGREASFNIRGFGNPLGGSVPTLRDGYRIYGSFQAIPEVANLEQIEVLKGPASILYGQLDPGGIINLVSKKPLAKPFYEAELQLGNRGLVRPRFDISGPLTDDGKALYRLNAVYQHEQSFRDFDTDITRFSIAPSLSLKIGDRTDLNLSLEYIRRNGPADFGVTQFRDGVAPIPRDRVINNPDDSLKTAYLSLGYNLEHQFNNDWKLRNGFRYISYDYDFSVVALPFIVEDAAITRFYADQDGQDRSYSFYTNIVGNFRTGSVRHKLTAGVDLNRSKSRILTLFDTDNPLPLDIFNPDYNLVPKPNRSAIPLFSDQTVTGDRLGVYLQDQTYLLENLILVAGLRYDSITEKTTSAATSEQTNQAVTPRVGLLYRPFKELSLFANYSQSFNPNTATTASGAVVEPERGRGFEVGLKTELFNQKVLATLTYFNITKENVAVADPNFPLFSIAVGEQKSQGVELDVIGEVLPGWKIIGSYAYTDAKVSNDSNPDIIGNRLFGIPKHNVSLWTTYEIQSGNLKGLGFGTGIDYVSDRFGDLANSYQVGDYLIGNLGIFYRRDRYRFALNIRNIGNAKYVRAAIGNQTGIEFGEPFTIIGSVSVQF